MCFLFLSCVSLSQPKNVAFILLHVVWQLHRIKKKSKTCSIESYNIEIKHKEKTKISKKKKTIYINSLQEKNVMWPFWLLGKTGILPNSYKQKIN